ncbi:hypothetical protein K3495_g13623 [Podosphaera aphanis]|nr:hypothetical protein K3495_g13623 [Podosphaera aphanis]
MVQPRNIRTTETDMRSMIKEAALPIEFWDEAVKADAYMRNRTATGPLISGSITSPQEAWTDKAPSIDHIKVWGNKCYSYINPKTIPQGQRKDKLVDRGRVGVFMGYSTTTDKQFKFYSPELGYTTRTSIIKVNESIRGGTLDLRLRNCSAGPQGTSNVQPDRKPRGRPIKGAPTLESSEGLYQNTTPQVEPLIDVTTKTREPIQTEEPLQQKHESPNENFSLPPQILLAPDEDSKSQLNRSSVQNQAALNSPILATNSETSHPLEKDSSSVCSKKPLEKLSDPEVSESKAQEDNKSSDSVSSKSKSQEECPSLNLSESDAHDDKGSNSADPDFKE